MAKWSTLRHPRKKKLANDAEKLGKEEQAGSAARNWVAGKGWFHKFVVLKFPTKFENYWRRYFFQSESKSNKYLQV